MPAPQNIELRPLASLSRWAGNYRIGNVDAIAASIRRFGFNGALRVWKDGVVMAGNHTLAGLQQLQRLAEKPPVGVLDSGEDWLVACIDVCHLGEAEAKAFAIADNRTPQLATEDEERLGAILTELLSVDRELAAVAGYQDSALERLLRQARDAGGDTEPEDPDAEDFGEIRPKLGDLWHLGPHRLLCGDATQSEAVSRLASKVDLIVTDPPYGIGYEGKTKARLKIQNDGRDDRLVRVLVSDLLKAAPLKAGGVFYVFSPAGPTELAFRLAIGDAELKIRQCLVWVKNALVMGHSDYHYRHESVLFGWKDGAAHYTNGDRTLDTVLEYAKPSRSEDHPTMKPVELIEFLIGNSSRPGETVYDCCLGSGTTLMAADRTDRVCVGAEIDPRYCEVILRRWERMTSQKAALAA